MNTARHYKCNERSRKKTKVKSLKHFFVVLNSHNYLILQKGDATPNLITVLQIIIRYSSFVLGAILLCM